MVAVLPGTPSSSLADWRELPARKEEVCCCWLCKEIVKCSVCEHSPAVLYSVWQLPTLKHTALHRLTVNYATPELNNEDQWGEGRGKLRIAAWIYSGRAQTSVIWRSDGRKVFSNWEKPGSPVTGLLVRVGFNFFQNVNVLFKLCLSIQGEF